MQTNRTSRLGAPGLTVAAALAAAAPLAAAGPLGLASTLAAQEPEVVTLGVPSPLVEVRMMIKAGSAHDPTGKEGLAALTAQALLQASYGNPDSPVNKEELAKITRPWGGGADPGALVDKETTTFIFTVPKEVLDEYIEKVMHPLFTQPLFDESEIERLKNEAATNLSGSLRYENIEMAGLEAIDNYIFAGTPHGHTVAGSVQGVESITREDVRSFYATYYRPSNVILGISSSDASVVSSLKGALDGMGVISGGVRRLQLVDLAPPAPVKGRELTIVAMPDAGATAIHLAFPIEIDRTDPDFWPLYVANVYFGTHRDSHSYLYKEIREKRGYNYGDYSYIEHFAYRPFNLFRPFNTPRSYQYFLIWIRPVDTKYGHHILKAADWELENLLRKGVPDDEVELSKNKAKVLYLNLAENSSRLLGARVDDAWWDMEPGYLEGYLDRIEAVTPEQVNAALRNYLQADNVKYLVVTEADKAEELAANIRAGENIWGKTPEDYRIDVEESDGTKIYDVPQDKLDILRKDAVWAYHPLRLDADRIRVVPVEALFETRAFVTETDATQ